MKGFISACGSVSAHRSLKAKQKRMGKRRSVSVGGSNTVGKKEAGTVCYAKAESDFHDNPKPLSQHGFGDKISEIYNEGADRVSNVLNLQIDEYKNTVDNKLSSTNDQAPKRRQYVGLQVMEEQVSSVLNLLTDSDGSIVEPSVIHTESYPVEGLRRHK